MATNKTKKALVPKLRFKGFDGKWNIHSLEDVSETFKSGESITSKDIHEIGEFPVFGGNGLRGYTDTFTHDGFFVLIGRQGALCGNVNKVKGKAFISEHAIAVRSNNLADTEWLAQKLDYMKLNRLSESSAQPGLAVGKLLKIKFPFPTLPEQQKIAAFLSAVDEKIQLLTRKKELLEQYKKGVMQQLFSGKLRFKAGNGKAYPKWEVKKLGAIGEFQTSSIDKKSIEGEKSVYLVNYMNVYKHEDLNRQTIGNLQIVTARDNQITSCNLKKGDILFTPSSETPDDIGHSVVIFEDLENCVFSYHLMRFRPKIEIDILYSHYFCNIPSVLKQLTNLATGSTRFTISVKSFSSILVNLPSLAEQNKIASFLTAIDAQIENVSKQITQTQSFKKGLLQQMFV